MLIVHEVMGRNCGWLTAATAQEYRKLLDRAEWFPAGLDRNAFEIHGIFVPEMAIDIAAEAKRLRAVMDKVDSVNIFVSEGAGVEAIVAEIQAKGQEVPRDASVTSSSMLSIRANGSVSSLRKCRRGKNPGAKIRLFRRACV